LNEQALRQPGIASQIRSPCIQLAAGAILIEQGIETAVEYATAMQGTPEDFADAHPRRSIAAAVRAHPPNLAQRLIPYAVRAGRDFRTVSIPVRGGRRLVVHEIDDIAADMRQRKERLAGIRACHRNPVGLRFALDDPGRLANGYPVLAVGENVADTSIQIIGRGSRLFAPEHCGASLFGGL
jgi:hypothetical protein